MNKKKYYLWPLGCAQNISDAERVATVLEDNEYTITSEEKEADLIVVLACSVRQSAIDRIYGRSKIWNKYDKKSLKILSGCVLPKDKSKMEKIFDVIFEINDLKKLPELIGKQKTLKTNTHYFNYLSIKPKHSNTFQASIPISNGCDNFCTYCAVPYTRGREVSRPFDEIVSEVTELIKNGYKEITLLGQNVNSYGNDIKRGKTFLDLLKTLNKIDGKFWIRFISNHPKDFPDELLEELPKLEKVTPYIHLPVQSGSTKVLKAMNRNYTKDEFLKLVGKIRKNIPNVAISTDTIVGFPGETKKDFNETIGVYKKSKFDMAYISQYSPRPGTVAAKKEDNVLKEEKKKRDKELNEVLKKTTLENNERYVDKTVEVLVEKEYKDYLWGRTDTFKLVRFKGDKDLIGHFESIKIKSATPWRLNGELPENKVIVIAGPTASGKTNLAIELAKEIDGEIINADSRSIYIGMDIGTGKPTEDEMINIPHHLFNIKNPDEEFSVAEFKRLANDKIEEIHDRGKTPIIVGGTGLYIDALVYNFNLREEKGNKKLRERLDKKSTKGLFNELKKKDPKTAEIIDSKNKRRLVRAIEIYEQTGEPKASHDKRNPLPKNISYFTIQFPREELYKRINQRVVKMFDTGLVNETKKLLNKYSPDIPVMKTMGYRESVQYLNNEITLEEAISKTQQAHRNFAKRQITWFKKNKDIVLVKNNLKDLIENL